MNFLSRMGDTQTLKKAVEFLFWKYLKRRYKAKQSQGKVQKEKVTY